MSYWKFLIHLTFLPQFLEFSVERFAFLKFNNFQIFWKLSKEISVPFVPISKLLEYFFEWKLPNVSMQVTGVIECNLQLDF